MSNTRKQIKFTFFGSDPMDIYSKVHIETAKMHKDLMSEQGRKEWGRYNVEIEFNFDDNDADSLKATSRFFFQHPELLPMDTTLNLRLVEHASLNMKK